MLSVIIPTFNEIKHGRLPHILDSFSLHQNIDIICVDSGSTDGTRELIQQTPNVKLIEHTATSRGEKLTIGAKKAKFETIILHHPRSVLSQNAIAMLLKQKDDLTWGAFTHQFDQKHFMLQFTSWYSNHVRGDLKGIFYLDHCIFVKKNMLEKISYLKFADVFEDTYLSHDLRRITHPTRLPGIATTSTIRFIQNGICKQILRNICAKIQFLFRCSHTSINQRYEKDLPLNCEYNSKNKK